MLTFTTDDKFAGVYSAIGTTYGYDILSGPNRTAFVTVYRADDPKQTIVHRSEDLRGETKAAIIYAQAFDNAPDGNRVTDAKLAVRIWEANGRPLEAASIDMTTPMPPEPERTNEERALANYYDPPKSFGNDL